VRRDRSVDLQVFLLVKLEAEAADIHLSNGLAVHRRTQWTDGATTTWAKSCRVSSLPSRAEDQLTGGERQKLDDADRRLRAAVSAYEPFIGRELRPTGPVPVHDAMATAKAQAELEAAEQELWRLREELFGWVRPSRAPSATMLTDQTLRGSIGWAAPAAFGAAVTAPDRRVVLVTGDGAYQLSAQEIGPFGRLSFKPIVFLLNNDVPLMERLVCKDPTMAYNDLAPWRYSELPHALGCDDLTRHYDTSRYLFGPRRSIVEEPLWDASPRGSGPSRAVVRRTQVRSSQVAHPA
jgi:hypothetical protein